MRKIKTIMKKITKMNREINAKNSEVVPAVEKIKNAAAIEMEIMKNNIFAHNFNSFFFLFQ